jgi:hypothetical protein
VLSFCFDLKIGKPLVEQRNRSYFLKSKNTVFPRLIRIRD